MTVISLMQIALLSWVLVVGAEDETHLLIQESQEIKKNPIEISSSKKFVRNATFDCLFITTFALKQYTTGYNYKI